MVSPRVVSRTEEVIARRGSRVVGVAAVVVVLEEALAVELMGLLTVQVARLQGEHGKWRSREWLRCAGAAEVLGGGPAC